MPSLQYHSSSLSHPEGHSSISGTLQDGSQGPPPTASSALCSLSEWDDSSLVSLLSSRMALGMSMASLL
jgi:hypothetical protein